MHHDLSGEMRDLVLVERLGFAFFVNITYKHFPLVCASCKTIRHSFANCKSFIHNVFELVGEKIGTF